MQVFPDARTELVGVVGHPVAHSLSPAFWNPALRDAGRNAVFLAFDVEPERFTAFIEGMGAAGARGFNITLPHKLAAFDICTERSEVAEQVGAVNVLVLGEHGVFGSNTDVNGIKEAVAELGVEIDRVLVIGAGGAGRAAAYALKELGAEVSIANRTAEKARALSDETIGWDDVPNAIGGFDIVVNTTSVGMDGQGSILSADAMRRAAEGRLKAVLDIVYRPDETPLVHAAREAGLRAEDGLGVLVHQGAETYRLFFGESVAVETLREAAWRAAGRGT